jgi:hypothetical protein
LIGDNLTLPDFLEGFEGSASGFTLIPSGKSSMDA